VQILLGKALFVTVLSALLVASFPFRAAAQEVTRTSPAPNNGKVLSYKVNDKSLVYKPDHFEVDVVIPLSDDPAKIKCGVFSEIVSDDNHTVKRDPDSDVLKNIAVSQEGLIFQEIRGVPSLLMPPVSRGERVYVYVDVPEEKTEASIHSCANYKDGLLTGCIKESAQKTASNSTQDIFHIIQQKVQELHDECDRIFEEKVRNKINPDKVESLNGETRQKQRRTAAANYHALFQLEQ